VRRSDLLPWTSAVGQQLPVRSPTRPVDNNGMEISATHGAGTPMFPRSARVLEQQMNRGHNPVATELQEPDQNLQFMAVVSHSNNPSTTRGSNLTAQSGIIHAVHESAGSKLRNRKAGMEQIALTTHKDAWRQFWSRTKRRQYRRQH
jgi:hypothetical protein